jgi:hypothetical protein
VNFLCRFACLLALSAAGSFGFLPRAEASVEAVWTVDDGQKVSRNAAPRLGAKESPLQLFGMRNETVAFQVMVRADPQGAEDVGVTLSPLGEAEISIFREDYVEIKERSHDLVWKPGSAAEPAHMTGPLPDRLVPLQGVVRVAPGENQGFWIDLWIPPEAAAGTYKGTLAVKSRGGCKVGCEIAVELEVLDRLMPEVAHARTMLWFSGGEAAERYVDTRYFANPGQASEEAKRALRLAHYQLAKRHRITLFAGNHQAPNEELGDLLSGRAFTEEMGYRGPGQSKGQDVLVLHAYGGELTAEEARTWLDYSAKFRDLKDRFVYVMDEPPSEERDELNRRVRVSKPMPAFVTSKFDARIEADIFAAPAGLYSRANARASAEAGKKLWIYNGVRPFTGTFAIDDVAVSPRVNPWIQYKLGIERWFYWEATYYFDFQGKRGAVDVTREPINFTNRHGDRVNGDGLLFYPGRDFLFPESDAGIDAPLPSIRLKNWRRGIEDVEYLVMARQAGFGAEVDALLESLLPRVVDGTSASKAISWSSDGKAWLDARRYLFGLLRDGKAAPPEVAPPPPSPRARKSIWPWMVFLGFLAALLSATLFRRR